MNEIETKVMKPITDHGIAAYLLMHGYEIAGRKGRSFYFKVDQDEENRLDELTMEYLSSQYHRFDHCIMALKKIPEYIPNM